MPGGDQSEVVAGIMNQRKFMFAYAHKLTKTHWDAEDLMQDTIVKALANEHQFVPGSNIRFWLGTIMRNTYFCRKAVIRRQRVLSDPDGKLSASLSCPPNQEGPVDMADLAMVLDKLPAIRRQMIVRTEIYGDSYQETSETLGVAIGTIKSGINRAREVIRAEFGESVPPRQSPGRLAVTTRP